MEEKETESKGRPNSKMENIIAVEARLSNDSGQNFVESRRNLKKGSDIPKYLTDLA